MLCYHIRWWNKIVYKNGEDRRCSSEDMIADRQTHARTHTGNVTFAGWQVTLCDPMWHVSSRSGVATLRTAIHLLLTYRQTDTLITILRSAAGGGVKKCQIFLPKTFSQHNRPTKGGVYSRWTLENSSSGTVNFAATKFWSDQEVLYDYKTDLHGIGNRSIV